MILYEWTYEIKFILVETSEVKFVVEIIAKSQR